MLSANELFDQTELITALLLSMFVIPAAYLLMRRPRVVKVDRPAFWRWRRVAT